MPRMGQLAATEVWAAAARTLTALTGQPRTDLVGSDAALWAAAARTLTDISEEEVLDLPIFDSTYARTTLSSAAEAGTFGSWQQLSADIGAGKRLLYLVVTPNLGGSTIGNGEIEIGEGGSGDEAAVARAQFTARADNPIVLRLDKALSDNARITARARDDSTAARSYEVVANVA